MALQQNTSLRELNLDFNKIGAAGAIALGAALQHNTTLTRLCLDNNNIGTEDLRTYVSSIYNIIQHNCILFQNQNWLPCMHVDFPNPCHQIIMATLLCNRTTINYPALPDHVWHFIFSFWKRNSWVDGAAMDKVIQFYILYIYIYMKTIYIYYIYTYIYMKIEYVCGCLHFIIYIINLCISLYP